MSEQSNTSGKIKMIRYCVQGHEIEFIKGEIIRNVCPFCKSPIDRTRSPVPYEEVQKQKEKEEEHKRTEQAEEKKEEEKPEVKAEEKSGGEEKVFGPGMFGQDTAGFDRVYGERTSGEPGLGMRPGAGGRPGPNENRFGVQSGMGFRPGIEPGTSPRPGGDLFRPGQSRRAFGSDISSADHAGFYISLYGERIAIPQEGAWIGREGLGKEWFDGNLMISRKHVFVHPDLRTGRLQVNEDKSLNGVFLRGKDGKRVRLDSARMMEPGDILWIYNIPLTIEKT